MDFKTGRKQKLEIRQTEPLREDKTQRHRRTNMQTEALLAHMQHNKPDLTKNWSTLSYVSIWLRMWTLIPRHLTLAAHQTIKQVLPDVTQEGNYSFMFSSVEAREAFWSLEWEHVAHSENSLCISCPAANSRHSLSGAFLSAVGRDQNRAKRLNCLNVK